MRDGLGERSKPGKARTFRKRVLAPVTAIEGVYVICWRLPEVVRSERVLRHGANTAGARIVRYPGNRDIYAVVLQVPIRSNDPRSQAHVTSALK
jgi:hypothetical protein